MEKHTNTNIDLNKPKPTVNFKKCSYVCPYHCAQLSYTIQHRTVLIIFSVILQTIVTTGREGDGVAQMSSSKITLTDSASADHYARLPIIFTYLLTQSYCLRIFIQAVLVCLLDNINRTELLTSSLDARNRLISSK